MLVTVSEAVVYIPLEPGCQVHNMLIGKRAASWVLAKIDHHQFHDVKLEINFICVFAKRLFDSMNNQV